MLLTSDLYVLQGNEFPEALAKESAANEINYSKTESYNSKGITES